MGRLHSGRQQGLEITADRSIRALAAQDGITDMILVILIMAIPLFTIMNTIKILIIII